MNQSQKSLMMNDMEAGVMFAVKNETAPIPETEWRIPQELENLDVVPFYYDLRPIPQPPREKMMHVCPICNYSVERRFHMNSHMNTHGFHFCRMCDYRCRTLGNINKHMREGHTLEEQIKAGIELDPSVQNGLMDVENASGNSQKPRAKKWRPPRKSVFNCRKCEHQSSSKEESWIHKKTHIPREQQLTCGSCEFVTVHKHHLEYHIRNHTGSKPFSCGKCNYTGANMGSLRSHLKSHDSNFPFMCRDCGYSTKYSGTFKAHLQKHHQPSPFSSHPPIEVMSIHAQLTKIFQEAPQDTIASSIESVLSQGRAPQADQMLTQVQSIHRLIHENVTEFCPHCDTPFNNSKLFEAHMDLHTPGDPFKCSKCQYGAGNQLGFALHVFLLHS
ncbi:unnamed protein product [Caenorhabditis brenneri]